MKGIELSKNLYNEHFKQIICDKFSSFQNRIAVGLVGEGSECYGYDDELSKDHDFMPSLCIWLAENDYRQIGNKLQLEYDILIANISSQYDTYLTPFYKNRRGVFAINDFYKKYIYFNKYPLSLDEFRVIPENNLSTATNGVIFVDYLKEFTAFRNYLDAFYPDDIRLCKIASRCMKIAQSGQYNFTRCLKRNELVALKLCESEFIDNVISLVFLINKKYKPFYKWMHKMLKELPILGAETYVLLDKLNYVSNVEKVDLIETICSHIVTQLNDSGISASRSDFLLDHIDFISANIRDINIRNSNILLD